MTYQAYVMLCYEGVTLCQRPEGRLVITVGKGAGTLGWLPVPTMRDWESNVAPISFRCSWGLLPALAQPLRYRGPQFL